MQTSQTWSASSAQLNSGASQRKPTLTDIEAERKRRTRKRCEASLAEFVCEGWHVLEPLTPLEWNWHHEALCTTFQGLIEDWARTQIARLDFSTLPRKLAAEMRARARLLRMKEDGGRFIATPQRAQNQLTNIPPGTMKSRILSVMGPAWVWIRWPEWRVLCLSSTPDVALRDADYTRKVVTSDWYHETFEPDWALSEDRNALGNYQTTRGGQRTSRGMLATITGLRYHAILADDPHDAKEVASDTIRESVLFAWDNAIANRVDDLRTSVRFILMQRLHERDLAGHVLAKGGWEHLCIPLEKEEKPVCKCPSCQPPATAFGVVDPRQPGEVIQASRFPPHVVAAEKVRLGSYGAAGQLQQRPAPEGGGMFPRKWWRFHSVGGITPHRNGSPVARPEGCSNLPPTPTPPVFERVILTLDANFSEGQDSDPAVVHAYGANGPKRYRLAREKTHGFPNTLVMMRRVHEDILRRYGRVDAVLVENKANGHAIIQTLKNEIPGVIPREPEGGKEVRAAAMQPSVEAGDWYLLDGAEDNEETVDQFGVFPNGAHDDDVDAASQAHAWLAQPYVVWL